MTGAAVKLVGTENNEIKKRKQKLVKHKRKNWKKTDISEIEEKIDDLRQQERSGGIRSEKPDSELFFVDKENLESEAKHKFKSEKEKSLQVKLRNLRCYRNLQPDPNNTLPAHIISTFTPKTVDSKRTIKSTEILVKRAKRAFEKIGPSSRPAAVSSIPAFDKDLWGGGDKLVVNVVNKFYLEGKKLIKPKKPKNFDKLPSALPAMEMPHPGTSYNPSYDDHQDLLLQAHVVELAKLRKEEKRIRKLDSKIVKMTADEIQNLWIKEMSGDLLASGGEGEENGEMSEKEVDDESEGREEKKMSKKQKTRVQKQRMVLIEKIKQKERENEKQRRIQENEIFRIKSIKKEIQAEEEKRKVEKEKRDTAKEHKALYGQSILSSVKYEDAEIDVKLSDELTGDLRNLKPEGNILMDRYKSLQKRNMVESRGKAKRFRKFWRKKYEKTAVKAVTA